VVFGLSRNQDEAVDAAVPAYSTSIRRDINRNSPQNMDGLDTESGDPRLNIHGTILIDGFWKGIRNTRPEVRLLDSEAYAHNLRSFVPSRAEEGDSPAICT
jgi:hypothetical protein